MDFFSEYNEKHLKVIDTVKSVLYKKDKNVFEKLDFYDDNIFSEPFLFLCINREYDKWINLLTFSLNKSKTHDKIVAKPVNETIYLPSLGYLKLKQNILDEVNLAYIDNKVVVFNKENLKLEYEICDLNQNDERIEFLLLNHPLLDGIFTNKDDEKDNVIINEFIYEKHIPNFNKALQTIKSIYPEYYALVKNYIKKVVFFKGVTNSFATMQAHGMVFFNVKDEYNEIFFLDNIIHQCAHVFFNTLTFDKSELFVIPHNSDLFLFTNDINDKGHELYGRYHGLFTQTNINIAFERCINNNVYKGDYHFELLGRFTSNMQRFKVSINKFDKPEQYKKEGLNWFTYFKENFELMYERNKHIIEKYNVLNQPYVFNYKIFKETNLHLL
ncbi:hypothetical protein, partial [Tenacibaculum maritimum]